MVSKVCFMIPTKIDSPSQEFYIRRCLKSIRRIYPSTPIIIALAKGTSPIATDDPHILQVENPYFSTLGCIYLLYRNNYAEYAYILHDSMVVNSLIPESSRDVSFIYSFHEPGMCAHIYHPNYQKLLSPSQYRDMLFNQKTGCFGVSMGMKLSVIERLGVLELAPKLTTKNDFCATERIFAYLCDSNHVEYDVLCGSIFGDADPWAHPELSNMSLEEILARNYRMCIIKSLVGRTE